jgi:uncharacterized protein (DUF302 family)
MTSAQTTSSGSGERAAYGFGATVAGSFDDVVRRTTDALKAEGFGVLTTIDVRKTLKEKLDAEFEPYVILGACNPSLAHRALQAEHELGLLLPCNVIVHQEGEAVAVSIVDPDKMLSVAGDNPELAKVAAEASARLRRVVAALDGGPTQTAS